MARTHASIHSFILACVAAAIVTAGTACDDTARGLKQDAQKVEEQTRDERAKVKDAARELGSDAAQAASRAGAVAAQAGEQLAERAGAAVQTVDVKTALMADSAVDATRIDVDTDYKTRTVTLKGYVPTAAERDRAETVAKAKADGYKVINQITVQPRG